MSQRAVTSMQYAVQDRQRQQLSVLMQLIGHFVVGPPQRQRQLGVGIVLCIRSVGAHDCRDARRRTDRRHRRQLSVPCLRGQQLQIAWHWPLE